MNNTQTPPKNLSCFPKNYHATQNCKLLIPDHPLQVLPALAVDIGLNEAIVLQQIHYWIKKSTNVKDGHYWIYNSIKEWQVQFPFWSTRTLDRTFKSLIDRGLIVKSKFAATEWDQRNWYRIDYNELNKLPGAK